MKLRTISLLSLTVGILVSQESKAITTNTANMITGLIGTGAGAVAYATFSDEFVPKGLLIGIPGTALVTWLAHVLLYQITPQGRFNRALSRIEKLRSHALSMQKFTSEEQLIAMLKNIYAENELPLIVAYNDLTDLASNGRYALGLLAAAKSDAFGYDTVLIQQCDTLKNELESLINNTKDALVKIKQNTEYLEQLKMYKEEQMAKAQLAVQQQVAHSQWQIANAQDRIATAQEQAAGVKRRW
jgi:hypothetical protein